MSHNSNKVYLLKLITASFLITSCGATTRTPISIRTPTTTLSASTVTSITVNTLDIVLPSSTITPVRTRPPTSTAIKLTHTPFPTVAVTFAPVSTDVPIIQDPPLRDPEIEFPSNLVLHEWTLAENSSLDTITFTPTLVTREQIFQKYQNLGSSPFDIFPSPLIRAYYNRAMLNGRELIVKEEITDNKTTILVFYDGREITQIDAGYNFPPTTNIWGLWTYENHWILEYVSLLDDPYGNSYKLGNIIWDGESLNTKFNYQESFGLTAINGRIFYFFRRDNLYGISYDGTEYNMDYDSVLHYYRGCGECQDNKNPQGIGTGYQLNENLFFFAERNGQKYFVAIWAK